MTVEVNIRFYGTIRAPSPPKDFTIIVEEDSTIEDVFRRVKRDIGLKVSKDELNIIHNGSLVQDFNLDKIVGDGDRIVLMPLVGGGLGSFFTIRLFE